MVRKEALRLLQALMLHNPFGPKLPLDRFDRTLADHRAMLEQLVPPEAEGDQASLPMHCLWLCLFPCLGTGASLPGQSPSAQLSTHCVPAD